MRRELHQFVSPRVTGFEANNLVEHLVGVLHYSLDYLTNHVQTADWLQICRGPHVMLNDTDAMTLYEAIRQRRHLLERRQLAQLQAAQVGAGAPAPGLSVVSYPSVESKVGGAVAPLQPRRRGRRGRRVAPPGTAVPQAQFAAARPTPPPSSISNIVSVTATAVLPPGAAAVSASAHVAVPLTRSRRSEENLQVISDDVMEQTVASLLGSFDF
jgi:hypothetical protein